MRSLLLLTMALAVSPAAAEPPWTKASPGGGGAFLSVDVSATGKVLVGSDLSGAYLRSGTGTWRRLGKDDGLLRTSVACVRWSPATGESALAGGRNGLFRSVNAGASWQATGGPPLFQDHYFGAIGWSRGHSATVYAAGAWSTADTTVLLWRSLDGGANWAAVAHDLPTSEALRALKLVVHPSDPNTVYMITGPDGSIAPTVLVPKRALYVSTNGGSTWALKSGADEALDVAVHPTTVGTLLMTVSTGIDNTGLVKRSIDGGDIWSMVLGNTGAVWWDGPNAYLINVGLDACGPIPANAGKFMSSDGGLNWSRIDTGSTWETGWTDCPHARGIPDGGVANALSGKGEYWVTGQFVWRYAGGKFTNAFSTGLGSDRWITTGIDNSVPTCLADAQSARTLYAGYYDLGMWRTEDSGASWRMINPVLPNWDGVGGNAASIVADPARPGMVWAAIGESSKAPYLYRVYRSTNFGDAWSPTTGLPYPAFLYGLSLDRQSPIATRKLWVTANGALYRSTDDGLSWQPASTAGGLPTTGLLVTEIDRRNGNTIFVGGWAGLWRSFDGGVNWLELSAGFDHSSTPGEIGGSNTTLHRVKWHGPHQILSDPTSQYKWWVTSYIEDTTEVAALHRGLYMSINNGNSWVEVRRGPHYRGIAIDSLGKRAMLTSSAATTSGCNSNEINATVGIEHGRSTDGLSWTWTPDSDHPDLRYPFGWTAYAGGAGQRWVGIPGYGFVRKSFPPVAGNDAFVVGKGSAGNLLPVLFNDAGEGIVIASVNVTGTLGTPVISGDSIAYTPPAGYTGVDWFAYTIQDVSGVTASATVAVNVVAVASDTVVIPISAGTDDAEESASGSMNLASSDIDMTFDLSQQKIGLRFNLVAVPQGADITGAYVQFHVDETSSEATSLTVRGQLADSPGTFTSASGNISARPPTLAGVPWSPPPWLAVGAAGTDQRTPDLSPVIQEIVDRPGWVSGNSLVLLVTGTGRRVAQSREFSAAGAATLYVSYGGGGSIPVAVGDPPGAGFAIHRVHPTPSRGAIHVELSLADARPARLELIDVAGRRVASRDLGPVGPGRRRVDLAAGLGSGIYIIRLTQGERSRTAKAVVLE